MVLPDTSKMSTVLITQCLKRDIADPIDRPIPCLTCCGQAALRCAWYSITT
jgi:hypothetical protein